MLSMFQRLVTLKRPRYDTGHKQTGNNRIQSESCRDELLGLVVYRLLDRTNLGMLYVFMITIVYS